MSSRTTGDRRSVRAVPGVAPRSAAGVAVAAPVELTSWATSASAGARLRAAGGAFSRARRGVVVVGGVRGRVAVAAPVELTSWATSASAGRVGGPAPRGGGGRGVQPCPAGCCGRGRRPRSGCCCGPCRADVVGDVGVGQGVCRLHVAAVGGASCRARRGAGVSGWGCCCGPVELTSWATSASAGGRGSARPVRRPAVPGGGVASGPRSGCCCGPCRADVVGDVGVDQGAAPRGAAGSGPRLRPGQDRAVAEVPDDIRSRAGVNRASKRPRSQPPASHFPCRRCASSGREHTARRDRIFIADGLTLWGATAYSQRAFSRGERGVRRGLRARDRIVTDARRTDRGGVVPARVGCDSGNLG